MKISDILIGTTNGAPCVENGQTTKAELAPNLKEYLRNCIRNHIPFKCDDWDALCSAVIEEYDYETWRTSLTWVVGSIRSMKKFENCLGSWNVPLRAVWNYQMEREVYKVFRKPTMLSDDECYKQLAYEFHQAWVPSNQWIQAEVSGSHGLSGLKPKSEGGTGGRFHMLYDKSQAEAYLNTRVNETDNWWFTKEEAVIKKVKGRNFSSIDLIYIPPKQWVWGINAEEMYVPYE